MEACHIDLDFGVSAGIEYQRGNTAIAAASASLCSRDDDDAGAGTLHDLPWRTIGKSGVWTVAIFAQVAVLFSGVGPY